MLDPDARIILIVIGILLVLSAFFSSAETALTSVNKLRMRTLADDGRKAAKLVLKLEEKNTKMLSAILIGNNIVNLSASALSAKFVNIQFGNSYLTAATGILTFLVIIFGEIVPKTAASIHADGLAMFYAPLVYGFMTVMTPVIWLVNGIARVFLFLFRIDTKKAAVITEDELLTYVDVSHEEGVIESDEREMIANVVDFGDSLAKDVMVPRIDVDFVNVQANYDEVVEAFRENNYSRLPVYRGSRDNVVGILFLKDFFRYQGEQKAFSVAGTMRKPFFTFEFKKTSDLLAELRKESVTIAVVLDEYGATAGIITLEDLLEEIVGEIRDEYDADEEDEIRKVSDTEYIVHGNARLEDINETLGLHLESDDYDSIAGHLIHLLEHLPSTGERITEDDVTYIAETVAKNRVVRVRILLPEKEEKED
ncbi:MAG: HlyC/CorC family transporter [Lachnospiraceae bacterium]|nr:HlyC/CorC family transporter [Lachnospiraceae bacterium]